MRGRASEQAHKRVRTKPPRPSLTLPGDLGWAVWGGLLSLFFPLLGPLFLRLLVPLLCRRLRLPLLFLRGPSFRAAVLLRPLLLLPLLLFHSLVSLPLL